MRTRQIPDLSGMTIGTWRVLYETEEEQRRHCMCQCVHCGLRKFIMVLNLWRGHALRCRACKVRDELLAG